MPRFPKFPSSGRQGFAAPNEIHGVFGSGGSRAISAGAGVLLACHIAGIKRWTSIGGVSGGSIPTVFVAAGGGVIPMLHEVIQTDFTSVLTRKPKLIRTLLSVFMQSRVRHNRPHSFPLSSEKLGEKIEAIAGKTWPSGYWTMAATPTSRYVFTDSAVIERKGPGWQRIASDAPASLGLAIRASCAIPGIMDAINYQDNYIYDGAYTEFGSCPWQVPIEEFGARKTIIACDVGDETDNLGHKLFAIWKRICGELAFPTREETDEEVDGNLIMIKPQISEFSAVDFGLSNDLKWVGIMEGLRASLYPLRKAGFLTGDAFLKAKTIVNRFADLREACEKYELEGRLAALTEELLAGYGLW